MSRRRTLPAWFAVVAMALQALWPLVAQAKPFDPLQAAAICSAAGTAAPMGGDMPAEGDPVHEHCKLCVSGTAKSLLAMAAAPALLHAEAAPAERITRAGVAPQVHRFRPPASPRAPPQDLL